MNPPKRSGSRLGASDGVNELCINTIRMLSIDAVQKANFHDGSAPTLLAVVNHYNEHFGLSLTEAPKADLVEYLKSL